MMANVVRALYVDGRSYRISVRSVPGGYQARCVRPLCEAAGATNEELSMNMRAAIAAALRDPFGTQATVDPADATSAPVEADACRTARFTFEDGQVRQLPLLDEDKDSDERPVSTEAGLSVSVEPRAEGVCLPSADIPGRGAESPVADAAYSAERAND